MTSKVRVVSYAINGRGMGHLVRQLAILRQIRRLTGVLGIPCEAWVLTSSEADTLARREGIPSLKMPSKAMLRDAGMDPTRYLSIARTWVLQTLATLAPDLLMVDTFPAGSFGELALALELVPHRVLVARRVREEFAADPAYRALLPLYETVITPDAGGVGPISIRERAELLPRAQAREQLGIMGDQRAVYVSVGGGGDLDAAVLLPRLVRQVHGRGWHVVVGAGPLYEGPEVRGPGITWLSRYTPLELLTGVDAAVASAGYNTFHELMSVGIPTVFLPLSRIADDQHERAQRAVEAGAAKLATSPDDVAELLEGCGTAEAARALAPHNGARAAARLALSQLVSAADLDLAEAMLTPTVVAMLAREPRGRSPHAMKLVRALVGDTPSRRGAQRAVLAELAGQGVKVPSLPDVATSSADRLERAAGLAHDHDLTLEQLAYATTTLQRKFRGSGGAELLAALEQLVPCWARFDDWMGVVSLLRAVPTQRALGLQAFAEAMVSWLTDEDDLFDALRRFSRLEGSGARPVAEVLAILQTGEARCD